MTWQPIETVPRGVRTPYAQGPEILGATITPSKVVKIQTMRWVWYGRLDRGEGGSWKSNGYKVHSAPTHWMPLPEPPAGEDRG